MKRTRAPDPRGLWILALAFLVGALVMTLELVAPRLVAPHLGTTSRVWTATLATFLAGLAGGNAVGGRLADRGVGVAATGLFAGVMIALSVPLDGLAQRLFVGLPHLPRVLLSLPLAFLPAAFALGLLPPALARLLLRVDPRAGRALGRVGAANALGSVAGTFAAGFVWVPRFGTRGLILALGPILALAVLPALRTRPSQGAPRAQAPERGHGRIDLRWFLLAGVAGAALLVLEIHASRVAGERLGASLYAWTSVIGVALAALAVGNLLGGLWAEGMDAGRALGLALAGAGAATLAGLWAPKVMSTVLAWPLPYPLRTVVAVALPYAVPAMLIGTLSPIVVRAALGDPAHRGRVVGRLYAAGTLGAVLAALLTGTWLIPWLGREGVLLLLAVLLVFAAILLRARAALPAGLLVLATGLVFLLPFGPFLETARWLGLPVPDADASFEDSGYGRVTTGTTRHRWAYLHEAPDLAFTRGDPVLEDRAGWWSGRRALHWRGPMTVLQRAWLSRRMRDPRDRRAVDRIRRQTKHDVRYLRLDRLVHSYVDLDDPTWLGYDYEQLQARLVRRLVPPSGPVRVLFLGGGGYAFQRHLLATRGDGLEIVTAEIDPRVTEVAFERLGLEADPRHVIQHEDARTLVQSRPPDAGQFDLVFGDAFNDLSVPFHLTTQEFARSLKARMSPDGVYAINVIDVYASGRFLAAFVTTLETVFQHVFVTSTGERDEDVQDTFLVLATDRDLAPILEAVATDPDDPFVVHRYDTAALERLRARTGRVLLTDDYAPVESLLAPVVEERDAP